MLSCDCFLPRFGAWLSLVERLVRDQEVRSSNLRAPTINCSVLMGIAVIGKPKYAVIPLLAISLCCTMEGQSTSPDSQRCAPCHRDVFQIYRQTGMGRSFFRPAPGNTLEDYVDRNHYYHPASDTHYVMLRRGDNFFQRRYQIGYDGKEINIDEKQIDFILGSGNHARTYLHRTREGALVQLPLAWYSEKGGYWAMSPGYDTPQHPDAQRPIGYETAARDRVGDMPAFTGDLPEGINCERCHGPGQQHLTKRRLRAPQGTRFGKRS